MLNQTEAMNNLFAGFSTHAGRSDFVIALKVPPGMLSLNDKGEFIFNGPLRFDQIRILFGGANPF
jgi:hypothetical protein